MSKLFETFVIITGDRGKKANAPAVTLCYPAENMKSMPNQVIDFCFAGEWKKGSRRESKQTTEFTFVLTKDDGQRFYGFCLRYTSVASNGRQDIGELPVECACFLSTNPYFSLFSHLLMCVYTERLLRPDDAIPTIIESSFSTSLPAAGATYEVEGQMLYRPKDDDRPLADVKLAPLVSRLPPEVLMQLLSALLCERRIILVSKDITTLSLCAHACAAILYPFTWQHIFIPVLPDSLLSYACAPMPFILGILPTQLKEISKLPVESVVKVDLDNGVLVHSNKDPLPPLTDPKDDTPTMAKGLGAAANVGAWALGSLSANLGSLEKSTGVSLGGVKKLVSSAHSAGMDALEAIDGDAGAKLLRDLKFLAALNKNDSPTGMGENVLVSTFLTFYIFVFGDYGRYVSPGYSKGSERVPPTFNKDSFCAAHRDGPIGTLLQTYIHSQMFEVFIASRVSGNSKVKKVKGTVSYSLFDQVLAQLKGVDDFSSKIIRGCIQKVQSEDSVVTQIEGIVESVKILTSDRKGGGEESNQDEFSTVFNDDENRAFSFVAAGTYNCILAPYVIKVLCWRIRDSDARLWRHAWSALNVIQKLIELGSERFICDILSPDFTTSMFMLLNWNNGKGRTSLKGDVNERITLQTQEIYRCLNQIVKLRWYRSSAPQLYNWPHWSMRGSKPMAQAKNVVVKFAQKASLDIVKRTKIGVLPPFNLLHGAMDPTGKSTASNLPASPPKEDIRPRKGSSNSSINSTSSANNNYSSSTSMKSIAEEGANDKYALSEEDKAKYTGYFTMLDTDNDGFIGGVEAAAFLQKSNAAKEDLRTIWNICDGCDGEKDGKLNPTEFIIAMHLTMIFVKKGIPIPDAVPLILLKSKEPPRTRSSSKIVKNSTPEVFVEKKRFENVELLAKKLIEVGVDENVNKTSILDDRDDVDEENEGDAFGSIIPEIEKEKKKKSNDKVSEEKKKKKKTKSEESSPPKPTKAKESEGGLLDLFDFSSVPTSAPTSIFDAPDSCSSFITPIKYTDNSNRQTFPTPPTSTPNRSSTPPNPYLGNPSGQNSVLYGGYPSPPQTQINVNNNATGNTSTKKHDPFASLLGK